MPAVFDLIVIGTGGFGSSVLFHAARRGARVLGLDRFPPAHDRGSSHGQTRIIRQAYFEHPDYVPLLRRAYELWSELEAATGQELFLRCGLIETSPPLGEIVTGVRRAAAEHNLVIENYSAHEAARRFPGFRFEPDHEVVFEPTGGVLRVEDCVLAHLNLAQAAGAEYQSGVIVLDWESNGSRVRVHTDRGIFEAASLVLTPGAWASQLLKSVANLPALEVRRKVLVWSPVTSAAYEVTAGGSAFLFERPEGVFYGFPSLGDGLMKFAEHTGGEPVGDPLTVDRSLRTSDEIPLMNFARSVLSDVTSSISKHATCLYTMTPDGHFLIDQHSEFGNVFFGAGFSGHGFKFTSSIGEALAQWSLTGHRTPAIKFLAMRPNAPQHQ